jgi:tRNA-splicing ligase RtcB
MLGLKMATPWMHILKKVDDYRWEIPASYKPGMLVPGLVFADEHMLQQIVEEQALEQVANVATLPGIVRYSLAMPDIHWGYGFPVGGVAAFRADDGIISPGAVGYDINCLPGDTPILHEFGYNRPISEFDLRWKFERIKCVRVRTGVRNADIAAFLKLPRSSHRVFKIATESGREIQATEDHPLLTPQGMVCLRDIDAGRSVCVFPFMGVRFEPPSDEVLVSEEDLRILYPGGENGFRQITTFLRTRGLLPLRMDNPRLPYLAKLLGFVQGDGSLSMRKNGDAQVSFYSEPLDLEDIRQDVLAAGFRPSRVYQRDRQHRIHTMYGVTTFRRTESFVHCRSSALALLLQCLGATAGDKARHDFGAPSWLEHAPRWMRRLYLAALFGAELTTPSTITGHHRSIASPVLSMNKVQGHVASGRRYLETLRKWLADFGVESFFLSERAEYIGRDRRISIRLKLQVSSKPANLVRLWTTVGYEYNRRKQYLGCVAAQYLRMKSMVLAERRASIELALIKHREGRALEEITRLVGSPNVNERFVERTLWEPRRGDVRIGASFPPFEVFLREHTKHLGKTGQVWERVIRKDAIDFRGPVYDFTVTDASHNFIAHNFVVSNCGVRLIRTNLTESEVRAKLQPVVDALFVGVPAGVGSTGRVKVGMGEIDDVLRGGARWAVQKGYGRPDDLAAIESQGSLPQSDPDAVSQAAKQRGRGQIGTLGSGNHFLEVQVVDQIYDAQAAGAMGIDQLGQVTVLVHCGSRGLGHQVCTDYLRVAERSAREHGITLVDRQLACMPFQSPEGQRYFGAMCASANFAWANRQLITHWVREAFSKVFGQSPEKLGLELTYDVAHNIAKIEEYPGEEQMQRLVVHRKGATRAFPPGHPDIPEKYRTVGQPVLVPGDMGRYSFIAVGAEEAMRISFGSTCHGAGRVMGRKQAVRTLAGVDVGEQLRQQGILVRAQDRGLLAEEAPAAYKDVADVVGVCHAVGISRRVVRTRPIGVVKG